MSTNNTLTNILCISIIAIAFILLYDKHANNTIINKIYDFFKKNDDNNEFDDEKENEELFIDYSDFKENDAPIYQKKHDINSHNDVPIYQKKHDIDPDNAAFVYQTRNPPMNKKTSNKCAKPVKNGYSIRDLDDGMTEIVHAPLDSIQCKNFNENDMYKESILRYADSDMVDRINVYRNNDKSQFIGKNISDVYDDINGENIVKQNTDLLTREGNSFSPGNCKFKTFNETRWHYNKENTLNGGKFAGSFIQGYDPVSSTNPAIQY